ncbi:MAG: hypothetical protein Kow0092_05700 [Deferrisomatales bacterium]
MGRLWWAAAALVGLFLGPAPAAECPPALGESAAAYRATLNEEQRAIRDSTLDSPRGIEETVQFDLGAHACHRGPGQAYREYGEPECVPAEEPDTARVRFPYRLAFRKALTLDALFGKEWQRGSDGLLQVTFQREGGRWLPVARREVLTTGGRTGGHPGAKAPPAPTPRP